MLHLAGKASSRRRPVNSALGSVSREVRVYSLRRHQQPSVASASLGEPPDPRPLKRRLPRQHATKAALRGYRRRHTESNPESQFHGRAAYGQAGSNIQRHARGAGMLSPRSPNLRAVAGSYRPAPLQFNRFRAFARRSTQPNLSFNRTANGASPWPRGSCGPSSASRPGRHTVVGQLTLR